MHRIPFRVYYEDTDAGGVMYYPNHLKFCERGRSEYLRSLGFENSSLRAENGIIFVVKKLAAEYFVPARLDDLLYVETRMGEVKNSSFVMHQTLYREETKIFAMDVVLVTINEMGRPVAIPEMVKLKLVE